MEWTNLCKKLGIVILLLLIVLFMLSCEEKELKYTPIELSFEIEENQSETCCYSDENIMIFSLGTRNGKPEGPLVNTCRIVEYDYLDEKVNRSYEIATEAYITEILPYEEGILYVDYQGVFEDVKWQLVFLEQEKEKRIFAEGECASYEHIPQLDIMDGKPIFLWQNETNDEWGINTIIDDEVKAIIKDDVYTLGFPHLMSNGQEYCVLVSKDSNEYGTFLVGNSEGIRIEYDLDMKIVSMAMTDKFLVCSKTNDSLRPELLKIDLSNGKATNEKMYTILYRLKEFSKDKCLAMKEDLTLAMLDINNCVLEELIPPEETTSDTTYYFYPVSDGKSIIMSMSSPRKYYLMEYI